jgi:hypothetical protein
LPCVGDTSLGGSPACALVASAVELRVRRHEQLAEEAVDGAPVLLGRRRGFVGRSHAAMVAAAVLR